MNIKSYTYFNSKIMDADEFVELLSLCREEDDVYYYIHNTIDSMSENIDYMDLFNNVIEKIRDLYYNKGESPWTDEVYDYYVDIVSHISDEFKIKYGNGAPEVGHAGVGEKSTLPLYMGSMNKLKSKKEIENWLKTYSTATIDDNIKYLCSAKLDGISALYADGILYTRGNGKQGRNISYLLQYLGIDSGCKDTLKGYYLRGELIMKKDTFQDHYKDTYNNSRNLVCGIMNRKYSASYKELYSNVDFVVYDVHHIDPEKGIMDFQTKFKLMKYLTNHLNANIHCVDHYVLENSFQQEVLDKVLVHWKKNCHYEIDGIIVSHNKKYPVAVGENPRYSFAYKNNNLCIYKVDCEVGEVIWNVSKDYYVKPKIKLSKEVLCENSKINYVTGFNAKYICEHGICPGSKIQIGLSGSVIPHIFQVYSSGNPNHVKGKDTQRYLPSASELGSDYVWSKNKVDLILVDKDNVYSEIKRNMFFFKSLNMKCGLQETTLVNLYNEKGIYKLEDILCLSVFAWCEVSKIGEKKARGFVECFTFVLNKENMVHGFGGKDTVRERSFRTYVDFATGSQCFDRGLGNKKLMNILEYLNKLSLKYPDEFLFQEIYDNSYVYDWTSYIFQKMQVFKCKGITHVQMKSFLKGLIDFNTFMYKLRSYLMQKIKLVIIQPKDLLLRFAYKKDEKNEVLNNNITKENVVMTGFRNKDLEEGFKKKGYVISNSVNKMTKYLIVKNIENIGSSTKVKKAQELGNVCILGMEEALARL